MGVQPGRARGLRLGVLGGPVEGRQNHIHNFSTGAGPAALLSWHWAGGTQKGAGTQHVHGHSPCPHTESHVPLMLTLLCTLIGTHTPHTIGNAFLHNHSSCQHPQSPCAHPDTSVSLQHLLHTPSHRHTHPHSSSLLCTALSSCSLAPCPVYFLSAGTVTPHTPCTLSIPINTYPCPHTLPTHPMPQSHSIHAVHT